MLRFLYILILIPAIAFAQEDSSAVNRKLPAVSAEIGMLYFSGDVGYSHLNQPLTSKFAYQFQVQYPIWRNLQLSAFLLTGKTGAEEKTNTTQLNFLTNILIPGLQLQYDFKKEGQRLTPYLSLGYAYLKYKTMTDLADASGNPYFYWSDGSIRVAPEAVENANAKKLYRDYTYETTLVNNSGSSIPIGAGINMNLSPRCSMKLGATTHLLSTDLIDGIEGNSKNDRLIYASVGFKYNFGAPKTTKLSEEDYNTLEQKSKQQHSQEYKEIIIIPDQYKFVDTNNDGRISANELNKVADDYVAGKSKLRKDQFYDLISFYYSQFK